MRLLILGVTGMLGHKLFQKLSGKYPETYGTARRDLSTAPFKNIPFLQNDKIIKNVDLSDFPTLESLIRSVSPDYVINCAGIIKQRKDMLSPIPCITINALLPHKLHELISKHGGRLIHFSTDCVFNGQRGGYTEADPPDAVDLYGRTKTLGEVDGEKCLVLRTSMIGRELINHSSLLDWFLSQNGKQIKGFTHAIYSGVTTNELAKVVEMIIQRYPELSGLYHVVSQPISKYELLMLARDIFGLDVEIVPDEDVKIDRSLCGEKFMKRTGYRCPSWRSLLEEIASETEMYRSWGIDLF